MFRKTLILIAGLTALIALFTGVSALEKGQVFFSNSPIYYDQVPDDAVCVQQVGNDWCLFLPGVFDLNSLYVKCVGADTVSIAGKEYSPDKIVSGIVPGESVKISVGSKTRTVHVYRGSMVYAVFLDSESGSMSYIHRNKSNAEAGYVTIIAPDGLVEYSGDVAKIKMRGNTTTNYSKKNYNIKLESKTNIGVMGRGKNWVLVSNVLDNSLLRNRIAYSMAEYAGLTYAPEMVPCDLYLNHEYNGCYNLCEKIEIGETRVNINDLKKATEAVNSEELDSYPAAGAQKLTYGKYKYFDIPNDPEDITGGYIIEYENFQQRYSGDPSAYTTLNGKVIIIKDPQEVSRAQAEYISSFIQGYENAIFAKDGIDPMSGKHYTEFVDFDSLVLKYLLEEVTKNVDGNASSQYYYKPSDSESTVAFAGPAWDYDVTFGSYAPTDKTTLLNPEGLYENRDGYKFWWSQLYIKSEFLEAVKNMWAERYCPALGILLGEEVDPEGRIKSIDEYAAEIEDSANMNFVRWPIHYSNTNAAHTGKSFSANIEYLKDFIAKRRTYLNKVWAIEK